MKVNKVFKQYMVHNKMLGDNIYSNTMIITFNIIYYSLCCIIVIINLTNS